MSQEFIDPKEFGLDLNARIAIVETAVEETLKIPGVQDKLKQLVARHLGPEAVKPSMGETIALMPILAQLTLNINKNMSGSHRGVKLKVEFQNQKMIGKFTFLTKGQDEFNVELSIV